MRTLDGVADDWPITYEDLRPYYEQTDVEFGVVGPGRRPGLSGAAFEPPLPPLPIGHGALQVARAHNRLGWHWWPGTNSVLSAPPRAAAPARSGAPACGAAPRGPRRAPTTRTGAHAIADGAELRHRRPRPQSSLDAATAWRPASSYVDARRRGARPGGDVVVLAANAIGTARLLLLSGGAGHPDGLANSSGLVGRRLMVHPFAT